MRVDKVDELGGSSSPDLVLLDIGLPSMTGWEFLVRYRANVSKVVPMLVCSGTANEAFKVEAVRHGASGYLPKPSTWIGST